MAAADRAIPSLDPIPRTRPRSERALVREAARGSHAALDELFERCWPGAYRAAFLIVQDHAAAEDIAQEALVAAVRNLHRFDRRRPLTPWLHRIVVNRAIDWTRMRRVRAEVFEAHDEASAQVSSILTDPVRAALARLAPEQRAVVVLRYLLEYTPGEIANLLELPRGTVNSRLRRALDSLEKELDL